MTADGKMKLPPATSRSRPAGSHPADVNRHFSGVGTRNEIGRAQKIEKLLARKPSASRDDFVFHHRNVRRRAAESDCAQLEEKPRQLEQRRAAPERSGAGNPESGLPALASQTSLKSDPRIVIKSRVRCLRRNGSEVSEVTIAKHFRGKSLQRRAFLPCIPRQACLAASLFDEGDAVPLMFDGHLGQEQPAASGMCRPPIRALRSQLLPALMALSGERMLRETSSSDAS